MVCTLNMPSYPALLGILFALIGLVAEVVALGTDEWQHFSGGNTGLFQTCISGSSCSSIPSGFVSSKLETVRAFSILGLLFMAPCFLAGLSLFCNQSKNVVPIIACVTAAISFVSFLTADGIYAKEANDSATFDKFGFSFGLALVALVASLLAAIFFLLARIFNGKKKVKPEADKKGAADAAKKPTNAAKPTDAAKKV